MPCCNSSSNPVITTRRCNMDPIDKITSTIHNGFVATDLPDQTPNAIFALLASFLVTMYAVRNQGHPYVPANRHNNSSRYFWRLRTFRNPLWHYALIRPAHTHKSTNAADIYSCVAYFGNYSTSPCCHQEISGITKQKSNDTSSRRRRGLCYYDDDTKSAHKWAMSIATTSRQEWSPKDARGLCCES